MSNPVGLVPSAIAPAPPASGAAADPLTSKDAFLKLLVAQLQNQNPLSPSDPVTFLAQLTQFSQLEQSMAMRNELAAIRESVAKLAAGAPPADPAKS